MLQDTWRVTLAVFGCKLENGEYELNELTRRSPHLNIIPIVTIDLYNSMSRYNQSIVCKVPCGCEVMENCVE